MLAPRESSRPTDARCWGGAENIAGWENIPLAGRVEEAEGLKTLAGNDANMMALGETLFGAAKGATDVVFVTVGTGIGCGALIDGRLYRGYRNRGMEMGHITVKCDGEGCACGGVGCLEHYASTSALVRRFCELNGSARDAEVDGKDVVLFYKEGNPAAVQAMEEHWNYLAHGIASMINLFAPQRVVVGGGISEAGDFYLEKLREGVPAADDVGLRRRDRTRDRPAGQPRRVHGRRGTGAG